MGGLGAGLGGFAAGFAGADEAGEHHGTGGSLVEADKLNFNFLAEVGFAVVNHDHGAIFEIGDTLAGVAAGSDDFDAGALAGEIFVAEGEGEFAEAEDFNLLGSSDFFEVEIVGEDEAMVGFGEFEKTVVDGGAIKSVAINCEVKEGDTLQFADGVEAGAGAGALVVVFAVGDELEFVDDAAGDDEVVADEAGLGDGEKARVHQN